MSVPFPAKLPATFIQFEYFQIFTTDSGVTAAPLVK